MSLFSTSTIYKHNNISVWNLDIKENQKNQKLSLYVRGNGVTYESLLYEKDKLISPFSFNHKENPQLWRDTHTPTQFHRLHYTDELTIKPQRTYVCSMCVYLSLLAQFLSVGIAGWVVICVVGVSEGSCSVTLRLSSGKFVVLYSTLICTYSVVRK